MKICAVQINPVIGDIQTNLRRHLELIDLAAGREVQAVFFPELSLTGYAPALARKLAMHPADRRLDVFQEISDARGITIGVGAPVGAPLGEAIETMTGVHIGTILFRPDKARKTYLKKYLYSDEEAFFIGGESFTNVSVNQTNIGLAICYELSIPRHAQNAYKNGAEIYAVSAAKTAAGVRQAAKRLPASAKRYAMTVLLANCTGRSGETEFAGGSAVWNDRGALVGQLDGEHEGILVFDTDTDV